MICVVACVPGVLYLQPPLGPSWDPRVLLEGGITESMKIYRAKVETGGQGLGCWGDCLETKDLSESHPNL